MRRSAIVLVFALSLFAGACGDGGGTGADSGYCKEIKRIDKQAREGTSTTAASREAARAAYEKAFDKIEGKAPAELKDDYKVLGEYYDVLLKLAADPKADRTRFTEMEPAAKVASKAVLDYNAKVCKFPASTTVTNAPATTAAPATTTTVK